MKPSDNLNAQLHKRLPIDDEEQILAVFRHHWFAYFSLWSVALILVLAIMGLAAILSMPATDATNALSDHRPAILAGAGVLSMVVLLFCGIPVWLRMQEQLVLTDEALLQILQPSLFASKISQLSLPHVADASVRRDFFGTVLGYGKVTIETPGEQDNYEFIMVSQPENVVKQIITAHENYTSALESGRMPTTWRGASMQQPAQQAPVQLSAEEYQKFLDYQRSAQAAQPTAAAPTAPQPPESTDQTR
jgi:hypothetical protein